MKYLMLSAVSAVLLLSACASNNQPDISEEEASYRRAKAQAIDNADYAIERSRRQDAIQDYGNMRMLEAEAVKKATENISKQPIILR